MFKRILFVIGLFLLLHFCNTALAQQDSVISTIWIPDSLGPLQSPNGIVYDSNLDVIYVCSGYEGMKVIDCVSKRAIARISGVRSFKGSKTLAVNTLNNKIYCASYDELLRTGEIAIIDAANYSTITTLPLPYNFYPWKLVYNHVSNKIYCRGFDHWSELARLAIVDGSSDSIDTIFSFWFKGAAMDWNSKDNKLYCGGSGGIAVLDGTTGNVLDSISLPSGITELVYDSLDDKIFCCQGASDYVTVIDDSSYSIIKTIPAGDYPRILLYNPVSNKVYCGNYYSHDITIIDATADTGPGYGQRGS